MNIYCDNYAVCNSVLIDADEMHARAKQWHLFDGQTQGGQPHKAILCKRCVDTRRQKLADAPPVQRGQQELFVFEVIVDPTDTSLSNEV